MAARSVQVPGGWLSVCSACGVETYANTLTAAEKAGRAHDRARHPAESVDVEANGVLW